MPDALLDPFRDAINKGDAPAVRTQLEASPELRAKINDPIGYFGARAVIMAARHRAVMDVLLDFGADINLRSDWDKGPFSVLDSSSEEDTRYYLTLGAILTAHCCARMGWIDELRTLIDANPAVVHELGGDGKRPLHWAATPAVVDLLLDRGAEIDARCVDHHSTPVQYLLAERPDVVRHLLARGATADIFVPARLGDLDLANRLIDADPTCLEARVNAPEYEPVPSFNIYCWTLGWYLSPHEVALKFDQQAAYELMLRRSSPKVQLLVACSRADETVAKALIAAHPNLIAELAPTDHGLMAYSMFYLRDDAVNLMLSLGFDPLAAGMDGGTLLHVACWHGRADVVAKMLRDHRDKLDLERRDTTHNGTALGWAIHGSKHSWAKGGDHLACIKLMIDVGATLPKTIGEASDAVRSELNARGIPNA